MENGDGTTNAQSITITYPISFVSEQAPRIYLTSYGTTQTVNYGTRYSTATKKTNATICFKSEYGCQWLALGV
jgi:hypothetical protein